MDNIHFITDRQIYEQVIQDALTTSQPMVEAIMAQYDRVWMGAECQACQRKEHCADYSELLTRTLAGN